MTHTNTKSQNNSCLRVGLIGCGSLLALTFVGPFMSLFFFLGPGLVLEGIGHFGSGGWVVSLVSGLVFTAIEGVILWKGGQYVHQRVQRKDHQQTKAWLRKVGFRVKGQGREETELSSSQSEQATKASDANSPSSLFSEEFESEQPPGIYDEPALDSKEGNPKNTEFETSEARWKSESSPLDELTHHRADNLKSPRQQQGDSSAMTGAIVRGIFLNVIAWGAVGGIFYTGWMEPSGDGLMVLALPAAALGISAKDIFVTRRERK